MTDQFHDHDDFEAPDEGREPASAGTLLLTQDLRVRADAPEAPADPQPLRDLVREMVRGELRGAPEGRSDRDLRDLVRREVAAAIDDLARD